MVAQLSDSSDGRVTGNANLRAYFQRGQVAYPSLHFDLKEVLWGDGSVVLCYTNQRGTHTAESMEISPQGKVSRVVATTVANCDRSITLTRLNGLRLRSVRKGSGQWGI